MTHRLVDTRRAAELFRWRAVAAGLAAVAIVGFAALAAIGALDRRDDAAYGARQAAAVAAETAHAVHERQQHNLEVLASAAASSSDEEAQRLLNRLPRLTPETRGAALFDPSGMLLQRSFEGVDAATLAAWGLAAAKAAGAETNTQSAVLDINAGDDTAVPAAMARRWLTADGRLGGIALIALDRHSATAPPSSAGTASAHSAWPFVATAIAGVMAILALFAVLLGRLREAERQVARQTESERALRSQLAATEATADRTGELSRAKSRFFAQVTHELRTPLNAILGFSETIRREMFGPLANSRYLEYAGLIHDAGSHLLSLINDLLDNARLEAGKMEIVPIRTSAAALARSALDLVELLAEGRNIRIATAGLSSCPDLNVDPRAMKQVLVNLLSNAIKYTPPGGRIDLSFGERDAMSGGGVAIEVTDTGIGMSAEDLRIAFEPFGRANAVEARRQQGTGLGLSLARALVRLHNGDVTLTSRLDSGTTARVILPASAAFAGNGPRLVSPPAKRGAEAA